jgi:CubicO group peptidase (beta-lactamase class C family)
MAYKMNLICLKSSVLAIVLLFLQPASAQYNWSELDQALDSRQKLLGTNVVAMIWKDDSLVFKKEMGGFNAKTQAPVASCSKWFTAALVMQFVDEGKISLDDPVVKYIPVFEKYMKNYITIRHCLSHMTGIADERRWVKNLIQRLNYSSLEEEVNAIAAREIRANAGTDFWYGNVGLNIAGRILEIVSKKKFDHLIRQKLFMPLGMKKTTFSTTDGSVVNPSGGAISTAEDYMKFLVMLLKKGKHGEQQILSENSVKELLRTQTKPAQIKYAPKSAEGYNYALGTWVIEEKNGTATAVASPGLFGTWPMIDFCRGYAYIVFVKNLLGEERADAHVAIKKVVDKELGNKCSEL